MSLFVQRMGQGLGKAFLDHVKRNRDRIELWTFVANDGTRRFYAREGFFEAMRTDGSENEESLPDIRLRWERARDG